MAATILDNAQVAIDTNKLYVEVDSSHSVLLYQWKGHILDAETKSGYMQILELIEKHKITNLIADLFKFKGGTVETGKYVNDVLSVKFKEAGVLKLATTIPKSAFGEFSNRIALGETTVSMFEVEKFTNAQDAYRWFNT